MTLTKRITAVLNDHVSVAEAMRGDTGLIDAIERAALLISETLCEDGAVYTFGNGGSASDADHFAAELLGRFSMERGGFRAQTLCATGAAMTAIANDYGYDEVFARQLEGLGRPGDVAVAITTSGSSPNIIRAIKTARKRDMRVVGFTGEKGVAALAPLCDVVLATPSRETPRVQEGHVLIYHIICGLVEQAVCAARAI